MGIFFEPAFKNDLAVVFVAVLVAALAVLVGAFANLPVPAGSLNVCLPLPGPVVGRGVDPLAGGVVLGVPPGLGLPLPLIQLLKLFATTAAAIVPTPTVKRVSVLS